MTTLPIVIVGMMGMCLSSSVGAALMMGDQKENKNTPTPKDPTPERKLELPTPEDPIPERKLELPTPEDPSLVLIPERKLELSAPRPEEVPRPKKPSSIQVPEDNMNVDPRELLDLYVIGHIDTVEIGQPSRPDGWIDPYPPIMRVPSVPADISPSPDSYGNAGIIIPQ
jgi:hypothetical protein